MDANLGTENVILSMDTWLKARCICCFKALYWKKGDEGRGGLEVCGPVKPCLELVCGYQFTDHFVF